MSGIGPEVDAPPIVSVVMPTFRETESVLKRTVESLRRQTFRDFELVLVVDDPSPHRRALATRIAMMDDRIRAVFNDHNVGVWASYNRGIAAARGVYVAIQDADDESLPDRLRILVTFLQNNPSVGVVGAALDYVDDTGARVLTRRYPSTVDSTIKRYCPLAHGTTLRRGALHDAHGGYDLSPAVAHAADYDLWCRWYLRGVTYANVATVLYRYYQHPSSFKTRHAKAILHDTITVKRRYMRWMQFGWYDRVQLQLEVVMSHAPEALILSVFYFYQRAMAAVSRSSRAQ